ncbi:MAG: helix-turn-helix domain-containing protein [Dysgonomonas sp.]
MRAKHSIRKICEFCKSEFDASRSTAKYCSHKCNSRALKEKKRLQVKGLTETNTKTEKIELVKQKLSDRPYISIAEASILLGICKQTVYNLAHSGKIKATRVTSRLTFVSRKSIDELIENNTPYDVLPTKERKPINSWYTLQEITEIYGIGRDQIRKIVKAEEIPEQKEGAKTLIAKNRIDNYFKKRGFDESIINLAEWYTIVEIMELYNMTEHAVYTFVSRYQIPKKQQYGKRFYSKLHIDNLKAKKE